MIFSDYVESELTNANMLDEAAAAIKKMRTRRS